MERITYRITLDAHRNGIQRTLQGFETADIMARRISVNLTAGGDTFELPMSNVTAMMYITTPSAKSPSINECVIDGNTIIYDCEPIVEEGITEMQLKVLETSPEGAKKVLLAPKFAVEVTKSNASDVGAIQTTTFTALEQAIAKADATYESRLLRVVIEEDCVFKAYYADGTVYENDYFREAMYNGNALLSQSYAVGGAGVREGEDTDNSKYYSDVSRSMSEDAKKVYEESHELMRETQMQANYTYFQLNFETGELGYLSTNTEFTINKETGNLETNRDATYTPEDVIAENVEVFINEKSALIDSSIKTNTNAITANYTMISNNAKAIANNTSAINDNASAIQSLGDNITELENSLNDNMSTWENSLETTDQYAKGQINALTYASIDALADDLCVNERDDLSIGQHIYIQSPSLPALYVKEYDEWVTVGNFNESYVLSELSTLGFTKIGHYKLCKLPVIDTSDKLQKERLVVIEGVAEFTASSNTGLYFFEVPLNDYAKENLITMTVISVMVAGSIPSVYTTPMPEGKGKVFVELDYHTAYKTDYTMRLVFCDIADGTYSIPYRITLYNYDNSVG